MLLQSKGVFLIAGGWIHNAFEGLSFQNADMTLLDLYDALINKF
jgi:hypothetical protein